MTTAEKLKLLIEKNLYSYERLEELTGIPKSSLQRYASGKTKKIPVDAIVKLAPHLKVPPAYLMGWDYPNTSNSNLYVKEHIIPYNTDIKLFEFPVIGFISAGYSSCAEENHTGDYEYIPSNELHAPESEYFVLRVSGDSMYPALLDGDRVLVRRQSSVESGKIAIVLYNSDEATIKKVSYSAGEDWIELIPVNPEYKTKRIEGADLEQCRILGEVIKLLRNM